MFTRKQKAEQMKKIMDSLSAEEIRHLFRYQRTSSLVRKAVRLLHHKDEIFTLPYGDEIDYYYTYSLFGLHWEPRLTKAKELLAKPDFLKELFNQLHYRGDYSTRSNLKQFEIIPIQTSEKTIAMFLASLTQRDKRLLKAYEEEPKFQVGAIIQMRANIGVDAIISKTGYSSHWQSIGRRELSKLKNKTFMVLGNDVCTDAVTYATVYSYTQSQGGSRLYKVLPIGETKTYYITEKFMKKCRTKAVKDARK